MRVLLARTAGDGHALAVRMATALLGRHPGPLLHSCPHCGSIEHGRPGFDAPAWVSLAHADETLVAASVDGPLGVDLEREADAAWVADEATGKLRGVGIVDGRPDRSGVVVTRVHLTGHHVAVATFEPIELSWLPEDPAGPGAPARHRKGRPDHR